MGNEKVSVATPIKIGALTLKNRITFAPTVKFDMTDDSGMVTPAHVEHYKERAEGGCGLICVEATAVTPGGRFGKNHLGLWDDKQAEGHKKITEACHAAGAAVIIQLNHTGYTSNPECGPAIGPSSLERQGFMGPYTTIEMTVSEIWDMQNSFIKAAVRAKAAGYDGVQLHGCHGYLINQFMSSATNRRLDFYGGTIANRARFATEIIQEIRRVCGPDFLISVRTSGYDETLEDALGVAEEYVKAGCDYLQVSSGLTDLKTLLPFYDSKVTDIQSVGAYFKQHFNGRVPVSCVGGLNEPGQIYYLIENGYVDTVDVAKAILADPGFANAVIEGTGFVKCFGCKMCQYGPFTKHVCPAELKRKQEA